MFKLGVCLCALLATAAAYPPKQPLIETRYGYVRGSTQVSRNGRLFDSFRGIPYAKPPVRERRFAAPEPLDQPWDFPIDATKEGPFCIQKNYFVANPKVEGQEDCLYLNVYVPQTALTKRLPVMVFIHWGGFFAGRGTSDYLGAEYFMDRDVILVTFNYRLGVLGLLSTLDDEAPGNYALKDQVLALKFVQENIERFGGDKNRVTLFGQSAGGGSTGLHLISPLSKGLFHQAISQSGAVLNLWAKPLNALQVNVTAAQAVFVGCGDKIGNNKALIECLRGVNAVDLVQSGDNFKYFSIEPITPFTTVVEKQTARNPEPFLTKEPLDYLRSGEFQKVPYIIGNVQDEGILRAASLLRQPQIREALNANFSVLLPQLLLLQLSAFNVTDLFRNITNFYLGGKPFVDINDPGSVQGFIDLYSDRAFVYGTYQSVILQSLKGHRPIWLYSFEYRGQYSYGDIFAATNNNINFQWGVSHCDDLLYLFRSPALFDELRSPSDIAVSKALLTLWTNFATYGDPDPAKSINWKNLEFSSLNAVKNENLHFLNITGSGNIVNSLKTELVRGYHPARMQFWQSQKVFENFPELY